MRIRNFTKMGEGLQCCRSLPPPVQISPPPRTDLPPPPGEKICNERGKICNVANLLLWVEGMQCCRSSGEGGGVCNVADLPGRRSARGGGLQYTTGTSQYTEGKRNFRVSGKDETSLKFCNCFRFCIKLFSENYRTSDQRAL